MSQSDWLVRGCLDKPSFCHIPKGSFDQNCKIYPRRMTHFIVLWKREQHLSSTWDSSHHSVALPLDCSVHCGYSKKYLSRRVGMECASAYTSYEDRRLQETEFRTQDAHRTLISHAQRFLCAGGQWLDGWRARWMPWKHKMRAPAYKMTRQDAIWKPPNLWDSDSDTKKTGNFYHLSH